MLWTRRDTQLRPSRGRREAGAETDVSSCRGYSYVYVLYLKLILDSGKLTCEHFYVPVLAHNALV